MKYDRRVWTVLAGTIGFLFILAIAVSYAYVVRAHDNKHQADERTRERTQQLAFLCKKVNALVDADILVVNPPGSVQFPQRTARVKVLENARCDPASFHLSSGGDSSK